MASYDDTATVSGSVVSIENGADDVPTKSLVVTIPPTISGVSSVSVTQTGRNLFNVADYSQIYADRDGVDSYNYRYMIIQLKPNTTYTVSQNSGAYSGTPIILINNALPVGGTDYFDLRKASDTKTYTTDSTGRLYIGSVNSYDDVAYTRLQECKVQIEYGSTAHAYEPYQTPTTYTASLGRTIYGGTVDIVNGQGTESYGRIIFDGSNDEFWQKHGSIASWFYIDNAITDGYVNNAENDFMICNLGTQAKYASVAQLSNGQFASGHPSSTKYRFVFKNTDFTEVADFKTWLSNNNMQVVYKLATPTDFTFTGQEINTRLGYNAFWSEQGDTELTYYKSGYGFTSVTVNKTGKNLIYPKYSGRSSSGITYVVNSDHSVTCSGISTNTSWAAANLTTKPEFMQLIPKGTYFLTGGISSDIQIYLSGVYVDDGTAITQRADTGSGATYTFKKSVLVYPQIRIASGVDLTTPVTIRFQLELGSQASSYEPYEAVTKTAKLHKVIYGGEVDVIKGTAKPKNLFNEDWEVGGINDATGLPNSETNKIRSKTFSSIKGGATCYVGVPKNIRVLFYASDESFISETANIMNSTFTTPVNCSLFKIRGTVDYGTTYNDDIIICYGSSASDYAPHFDPFTFPPISISTDEGENNLFANEGDSAITYRKAVD